MQTYNVPKHSGLELVSSVKLASTAALYGIGINLAILKEKATQNKLNQYQNSDQLQFPYSPDAKPNSNGGYDATASWDGKMSSSLSGMPVMCYAKFVGGTYTDLEGNSVTFDDVILETVIITATMNPNINVTNISGRKTGSVKEYIGLDDWDIEFRALVTSDAPVNQNIEKLNQTGVYPRENVAAIFNMISAPLAIPIECWYLNQLNINYVVMQRGVRFEQIEGEYSVQRLVLPALSDYPLIIKVGR